MFFLFSLIFFTKSDSKVLCFTTSSFHSSFDCSYSNTLANINISTNVTDYISKSLGESVTDIKLYLSGELEYQFPLNLFNNKKVTITFENEASGKFDVSGISNINAIIGVAPTSSYGTITIYNVNFEGSNLSDELSSITLNNINLTSTIDGVIKLNEFSASQSTFPFTTFNVQTFSYANNSNIELTVNDKSITINNEAINFENDNLNLSLKCISSYSTSYQLTYNNQLQSTTFISSIYLQSNSITFDGNDFSDSISLHVANSQEIITNVSNLPIIVSNTQILQITAQKSVNMKGSISLTSNLIINVDNSNSISERIQVAIGNLELTNSWGGKIQIMSSWIDLTVDSLTFSSSNIPVEPCVGSGGSSTFVANTTSSKQSSFTSNSITVHIDVTGVQDDETLSTLLSKEWNAIKFKSFTKFEEVEKLSLTFSPSNINGFTSKESILNARSIVSDNYDVIFNASSFLEIPLLLCYTETSSTCGDGYEVIDDLSTLATKIPAGQKMINLTLRKTASIDLSTILTPIPIFTISIDLYNNANLESIQMNDNSNIEYLIFKSAKFAKGPYELKASKIEFEDCDILNSDPPIIKFSEHSVVVISSEFLNKILPLAEEKFPLTYVNISLQSSYSGTSLEIFDTNYSYNTGSYSKKSILSEKLPKVVFSVNIENLYSDFSFEYIVSTNNIDNVSLLFVRESSFDKKITIIFRGLDNIVTANGINVDFGNLGSRNIIDLNNYPKKDYLSFTGNNVEIINKGFDSDSIFCISKAQTSNQCDEGFRNVEYDQASDIIKASSSENIKIVVIDAGDGTSPSLSLSSIEEKETTISGKGDNPKISINCDKQLMAKSINFSSITVLHSGDQNLRVSTLILNQDCIIDSSFTEVLLTAGSLICNVSHLNFKTIKIQSSLDLYGNAEGTTLQTKVSFEPSATFQYELPSTVTFNSCKLVFSGLEFNLSHVIPSFTISSGTTEFSIVGINGNINTLGSDINLICSRTLKISGTWANIQPTKFITFNDFASDLFLNSQNIPVNILYSNAYDDEQIMLTGDEVSISGKMSFYCLYSNKYNISSSGRTNFKINEVCAKESFGTAAICFGSPNINLTIGKISENSAQLVFYLLIDLDSQNNIEIINEFDNSKPFLYNVEGRIYGYLSDQKVIDFINNNHTLITLNSGNSPKSPTSSDLKFTTNLESAFNTNNFKLEATGNELLLYASASILSGNISLHYGDPGFSSDLTTEIKNEDLKNFEKFLPIPNASVSIVFYKAIPSDSYLDLNKESISLRSLTLKSSSQTLPPTSDIYIKLGNSVTALSIDGLRLNIVDTDPFTIQEATLTNKASFANHSNYASLQALFIDLESFLLSGITGFNNDIYITIQSSSSVINFTTTGLKLISEEKAMDVDISKYPKANLYIRSGDSPIINLESNVKELTQINSLVFYSRNIQIGSNWNLLSSNQKVNYKIDEPERDITVTTASFPFNSWDLMYKYAIKPSEVLSPFIFSEKLELKNQEILFDTPIVDLASYDIVFDDITLIGNSKIKCNNDNGKQLIAKKVTVQNGASNLSNVLIAEELNIDSQSSLNEDYLFKNTLDININWDLNKSALFSPSKSLTVKPKSINIIYTGSSIEGKEEQFDNYLSNGVVFMKNVAFDISSIVHFKSENVNLFRDGTDLVLDCRKKNNEIQLISTKSISGGDDSSSSTNTDSDPIIESSSELQTNSEPTDSSTEALPTNSEATDSSTEALPTNSEATDSSTEALPTESPIPSYVPSINDSYVSEHEMVQFTETGYFAGDKFISTKDDKSDIKIIKSISKSKEIELKTSSTGKPNHDLFISPQIEGTVVTIQPPENENEGYGTGKFGIHANSKNPTVNLPNEAVPLSIFNNEKCLLAMNINSMKTSSNANVLNDHEISCEKLIISNGEIQTQVNEGVNGVEFLIVEAFAEGKIKSLQGTNPVETKIHEINLHETADITITNPYFNEKIAASARSRLMTEGNVKLNSEKLIIELENSYIDFNQSNIDGTCKQIKISETDLQKDSIQLVCGYKLDCQKWIENIKYSDSYYKYLKCETINSETCLVANHSKKKSLSTAAIVGIAIAAVVVVTIIVVVVIVLIRKKNDSRMQIGEHSNESIELLGTTLPMEQQF